MLRFHQSSDVSLAMAALIFVAGITLPSVAVGQERRPNFTGTWVLNATKSQIEIPTPESTTFVIEDSQPIVRIFRTHVRGGERDTATVLLRTDSSRVDWQIRQTALTSRTWWDGNELVFWTGFTDPQRAGEQTVRYSLSADRQTFTAVERVSSPSDKHVNRWVFDRKK
jgi:hypothetical protein